MNLHQPLNRAIKKAGTAAALARCIGVTPQAIGQWDKVPINRVAAVEQATGISRYELRPDIFGDLPLKSESDLTIPAPPSEAKTGSAA